MQRKKRVIVSNEVFEDTLKRKKRVLFSMPLKDNEFKLGATKEIGELEEASKQNDVLFNQQSSTIKEGDKVRATFVDQGEKIEKIKTMKEEQLLHEEDAKQMRETPSTQENLHSLLENLKIKDIVDENDLYVQGNYVTTVKSNSWLSMNLREILWNGYIFGNKNFILNEGKIQTLV